MRTRKIEYKKKRNDKIVEKYCEEFTVQRRKQIRNKTTTKRKIQQKTKIKQMQEGDTEKTGESEPLLIDQQ